MKGGKTMNKQERLDKLLDEWCVETPLNEPLDTYNKILAEDNEEELEKLFKQLNKELEDYTIDAFSKSIKGELVEV